MDVLGRIRISWRLQPSPSKLAVDCIDVIGRDDNRLTEFAVAAMAGEEELIPTAREDAKGGIVELFIAIDALEIEHTGVECHRHSHVRATDCRDNRHMSANLNRCRRILSRPRSGCNPLKRLQPTSAETSPVQQQLLVWQWGCLSLTA
jgi:hypothetical protein